MNKEMLVAALVAGMELAKEDLYLFIDDDFKVNPKGVYVKHNYRWEPKQVILSRYRSLIIPHPTNGSPYTYRMHDDIKEIDSLATYSLVTTKEFRMVRYATQRAQIIIDLSQ